MICAGYAEVGPAPSGSRPGGRRACALLFLLLGCVLVLSCSRKESADSETRRITRPMMGTLVEVVWRATEGTGGAEAARLALDRMEELASRMDLYSPASELARVNAAAGKGPVKVSDALLDVIEESLTLSRMTGGAFDATVGPLEAAWGDIQHEGGGRLPGERAVHEALARVGYQRVRIDRNRKTVFLEKAGMRLDLGGIAKGYIADQGMACLQQRGIRDALINAGGDIRSSCSADSPPWRIGLQDPLKKGRLLGVFVFRSGAVVTSGTYERYFETKAGRFTHIMNPRTGRPVEGLLSVTVVAARAFLADGLATAIMVKGRREGVSLLGRLPRARGVLVERDGTIWVAEGLKGTLELGSLPAGNTVRFYGAAPLSRAIFPPARFQVLGSGFPGKPEMGLDGPWAKTESFPEPEGIAVTDLIVNPDLLDPLFREPGQQHAAKPGADTLFPPAGDDVGVVNKAVPVRQNDGRTLRDASRDEPDDFVFAASHV